MILGIGNDIINVARIERAMRRPQFMRRVFTEAEREYFAAKDNSPQTVAGVFAAKEAVSKALGSGFVGFSPVHIEISRDTSGSPCVILREGARLRAAALSVAAVHVTISHEKEFAMATAVAEG